ncbi:HIT family protein [Patescibacteria group bacterium]|nr:HIT family protein [Patescibacteria group bacterium]
MDSCIFCKIVKGEAPSHTIWEDEKHLAFLSIFPNTPGFSVVVTKEHYGSYVFDLPDEVYAGLLRAAKTVGKKIDATLPDVGRTGLLAEGFGVDHAHVKLFPMHGTKDMGEWKPIESKRTEFYEVYPGYLSSHDAARADDGELAELAKKIRD